MAELDGTDDYFDSRDVISRIAELETEYTDEEGTVDFGDDADEREEYEALIELQEAAENYISDWRHGEAFILDSYFEEYAQETAEDLGFTSWDATWPHNHIDWAAAAEELKTDYTSFRFRGETYWAR